VLSQSTKDYDRGSKFEIYRSIASLRDYLLIAQDRVHIEHHTRQNERTWLMTETNDPAGTIALASLGVEIPVPEIYAGVSF
jgi:Uma2 family endonuclease